MNQNFKYVLFYTILSLSLTSSLQAGIVTVKQDGTGDYTTIQAGIYAALQNSGDTVLVWPGVYYEHIVINGNYITVASLYIINAEKWYIHNTIIDGYQSGRCVTINGGNYDLILNGFTIRNGHTEEGYGGIYCYGSTPSIENCIIEHNEGCGINGMYTTIYLKGTTIRYNHGFYGGGAIAYGLYMDVIYDSVNRCNIYCNNAPVGCEIAKSWFSPAQEIFVDTFTVIDPDYHFVFSYDTYNLPVDDIEMDIEHGFLEPVDGDVYVNPVTGDNQNSGTNPVEPVKTIAFANSLIKPDSLNHHTIHLANGIYSLSANNEKLPLGSRSFIYISGENKDSVIIDAEYLTEFYRGYGLMHHCKIENLTMKHGKEGIYTEDFNYVTFNNMNLQEGGSTDNPPGLRLQIDSLLLNKVTIKNLVGGSGIVISNIDANHENFTMINCKVENNGPELIGYGGGGVSIAGYLIPPSSLYGKICNLEITNNLEIPDPEVGSGQVVGFTATFYCNIDLVNATIANNILRGPMGFGTNANRGAQLNIYNSILYGDSLRELSLGYPSVVDDPSTCRVYYSDIEAGQNEVMNWNGINTLVWGPGNISSDPLWDTTAAIPYALPWNSPCVNAGTPMYDFGMQPPYIIEEDTLYKLITFDYDTIVLPQTDLAGNPRIFDGRIDMGAYECQDTTTGSSKFEVRSSKFEVTVYPNPFYANTFISFELDKKAEVQAMIYDMNGNEVKKLMDASLPAGQYNMTWEGDDETGQKAGNGTYIVSIFVNGNCVGSEKVVKKGK